MTRVLPSLWIALSVVLVAAVAMRVVGAAPLHVFALLLGGTWQSGYGIGQVLFKATPLIFTGLSVAICLRAGLFNIGAEGQLIFGAFATAWCGAALPAQTPSLLAWPLCLGAGALAGGSVGAAAGAAKAWRGAHEVIVTIMLNFIVRATMVGLGQRLFLRESVHTATVVAGARLARLGQWVGALHGSAVSTALLLALLAALLVHWLVERTRPGYALRVVGAAPSAARTVGISAAAVTIGSFALAGALSGLVGANFVLGYKGYYEDGFSGGVGYLGIAVAVVGRASPLGVVLASLALGTLLQGALAINALVPKELIDVLIGLIILGVTAEPALRGWVQRRTS